MRRGALFVASWFFLFSGAGLSAQAPATSPTAGPPGIRTGTELLDKLSSPVAEDNLCAIGAVMGVYAVQMGEGALPEPPVQKQIADLVQRDLATLGRDKLARPANKLIAEILEKEKGKLREIVARTD